MTAGSVVEANSDVCPFINDVLFNLTNYDKIRIAVMSVTVAPIRLVLTSLSLLLLWPFALLPTAYRPDSETVKPLDGWRLACKPIARLLSRLVFFSGGFYWIKVVGEEDKDVKVLALAPHSSYFDVLGIVYLNFPSVIGRAGSDKVPLFGGLTKLTQPLIVDRENQESRSTVVKKIFDRLNSPLKWPKLAIYTEGTCTNRKVLLQFKQGAFLAGLPVQPVCFVYNDSFDSYSWSWKGPSVWMLLWLTLCQFYNSFEIHYLPVYYPNDEEKKNTELYANNVRLKMAEYLKIPITDCSFEDVRLMTRIEKHKLPWITGQIKVTKIIKKFGVNMDTIFDTVPLYAKLADLGTGIVNSHTFNQYMQIKPTESLNNLYYIFDRSKKGCFTFVDYLEGYFGVISAKLNLKSDETADELEEILNELKLTENEDNTDTYTYDNFNKILNKKFSIEFKSFEFIDTKNTKHICRRDFKQFLTSSPLHLYYLLVLGKKKVEE